MCNRRERPVWFAFFIIITFLSFVSDKSASQGPGQGCCQGWIPRSHPPRRPMTHRPIFAAASCLAQRTLRANRHGFVGLNPDPAYDVKYFYLLTQVEERRRKKARPAK